MATFRGSKPRSPFRSRRLVSTLNFMATFSSTSSVLTPSPMRRSEGISLRCLRRPFSRSRSFCAKDSCRRLPANASNGPDWVDASARRDEHDSPSGQNRKWKHQNVAPILPIILETYCDPDHPKRSAAERYPACTGGRSHPQIPLATVGPRRAHNRSLPNVKC